MSKPCNKCGDENVQWANNKKQDGTWGPLMFSSIPGGANASHEISIKDGKGVANFVPRSKQSPSTDYFAPHYKDCGSATPSAPRPAAKPTNSVSGETLHVVVTRNSDGTAFEGVLTEKSPF